MNWAPAKGTPCFDTLHRCFPGALPGDVIKSRSSALLREKFGMDPDNTLYGQSICPDEINNEDGDLASHMQQYWGEVYPMGGIGGAPYVGKAGFAEFASHIPDGGNVLVLFGPHIAISEGGELGKYLRIGQSHHSGACGAVLAAYNACRDGTQGDFDPDDMQQCWLKAKVQSQMDKIHRSHFPIHTLIQVAYECVKEKLLEIVKNPPGKGKLAIIGGIQLNMPAPFTDHYQPLFFQVVGEGMEPLDVLAEAFNYTHDDPARYQVLDFPDRRFSNLFNWLRFAPGPESPVFETLHKCFPGALPGVAVVARTAKTLEAFGLDDDNTIYGQSICPDEINNEETDLGNLMKEHWGELFPMGGIGGAPFVGKTGFMAFSHHVPDDGHVLVLFGPHIAISESGELGKYLRVGQSEESLACGALLTAYQAVKDGSAGDFDPADMQSCWLKGKIFEQLDRIEGADDEILALINVAYECVRDKIQRIVNHDFGQTGQLVLIGGIQINMPEPYVDHFQPLLFTTVSMTSSKVDLMATFDRQYDLKTPDAHVPPPASDAGEDAAALTARMWKPHEIHEAGFATRESIEELRKELINSRAEEGKRLESLLARLESSGGSSGGSLTVLVLMACTAAVAATALLVTRSAGK